MSATTPTFAAVFSHVGGYGSDAAFSDGMNTAVLVGAAVVAIGAGAALAMPGRPRRQEALAGAPGTLQKAA